MLSQVARFHSFSWLSNISVGLYVCVCLHTYAHIHFFFIHLSTDGHFGCFHNLAIVNNAAVNIYLFELMFHFLQISPPKWNCWALLCLIAFVLKPILSDTSIVTPASFIFPISILMNYLFRPVTFSLPVSIQAGVSWRQYM